MKLVCNFGINDQAVPSSSKEYKLWVAIINRAYNKKWREKIQSYKDCSVSTEFRRLSDFTKWAENQIGFGAAGWELDKDILNKGNKEYHPNKCVFIPKEVNLFIRPRKSIRGNFLIGVKRDKWGNYISQISIKGKNNYLGTFNSEVEAFNAYKIAKEQAIKDMANKYKNEIDPRAYHALMNYQVEITD